MEIAKYWKTIVDTLQDGLMVLDSVGNILAVNPAAERLTGYLADGLESSICHLKLPWKTNRTIPTEKQTPPPGRKSVRN